MDHLHVRPPDNQALPHIVQVFQQNASNSKMQVSQIIQISHPSLHTTQCTYHPTVTTESLHIPVTSQVVHTELQNSQIQTPIVVSCQETDMANINQPMQSHMMQNSDVTNIQYSHLVLQQHMFKEPSILEGTQMNYQSQFNEYLHLKCDQGNTNIVTKMEPLENVSAELDRISAQSKPENVKKEKLVKIKSKKVKKERNTPNPAEWACNQRKLKHQRGEAYVNRRGKYVPEKQIKNKKNCIDSCKYKCNSRIPDEDRQNIFKEFYSLSVNEKKHFLLSTTERNSVRCNRNTNRKYAYKYFFIVRSVKTIVCKNFYLGTLAISQKPIYNVHKDKSDINLPKPDGRGKSQASCHAFPDEVKSRVRNHILSFKTIDAKPVVQYSRKRQYLEDKFNVRQMFLLYTKECEEENISPVKESMYRNILKNEFNLRFKKQLCYKCKGSLKREK